MMAFKGILASLIVPMPLREMFRRLIVFLGYLALFAIMLGIRPHVSEAQERLNPWNSSWNWPIPIQQSPLLSPLVMSSCEKFDNKNFSSLNLTNFNTKKKFQCNQQPQHKGGLQ
ncbi:hypothetical protein [Pseudobdellovibrio exovorus]|uniref:Uncharacterized protein n=1 Tax=Pseudobdellovibrio exovorus JSS TaxID=1184267 RepID=M4V4S1_9BACT|nr:hypothetical protein [Pseudobdellovibrio exovorus]AGH94337.1 hypothetical protein A11Q_117 [Pseudobdellovibrio exovorus JSS]